MNNLLKKIKKAPWVIKQPLTKVPSDSNAKISDLFIWRHDKNWQTFFELLDMASILGDTKEHKADIIFFNYQGKQIHKQLLILNTNKRNTLDISKMLADINTNKPLGNFGTFCIFHHKTPEIIVQLNTFIAERGYISYQYKNKLLRSYVHGNFDAISDDNKEFSLLGGVSFLTRAYNLQYVFLPDTNNEIALVNTSHKLQKVQILLLDAMTRKIIKKHIATIVPKTPLIHPILKTSTTTRLIIKSKMIMARPIVFVNNNDGIDVFHG